MIRIILFIILISSCSPIYENDVILTDDVVESDYPEVDYGINEYEITFQGLDRDFIVYIPDSSRYTNNKLSFDQKKIFSYKEKIINDLKKEDINIIDLTEFFEKKKSPRLFYPFGFNGHFNKKGYKEISKVIFSELKR